MWKTTSTESFTAHIPNFRESGRAMSALGKTARMGTEKIPSCRSEIISYKDKLLKSSWSKRIKTEQNKKSCSHLFQIQYSLHIAPGKQKYLWNQPLIFMTCTCLFIYIMHVTVWKELYKSFNTLSILLIVCSL